MRMLTYISLLLLLLSVDVNAQNHMLIGQFANKTVVREKRCFDAVGDSNGGGRKFL